MIFLQYLSVSLIKTVCYLTCTHNIKHIFKRELSILNEWHFFFFFLGGCVIERAPQQQDTDQQVPSGICHTANTAYRQALWRSYMVPPLLLRAAAPHSPATQVYSLSPKDTTATCFCFSAIATVKCTFPAKIRSRANLCPRVA